MPSRTDLSKGRLDGFDKEVLEDIWHYSRCELPAELLLKRRVATCLPSHTNENRGDGVHDRLEERRAKMTT